jgi:cyclopropane-fatty-acyl-phospholipid synthase
MGIMSVVQMQQGSDQSVQRSRALLQRLLGEYRPRDFAVRFWDGSQWEPDPGQPPRFTLVLQHPGTLRQMFWPFNSLALAEAYIYGDFDIEGDLVAFFRVLRYMRKQRWGWRDRLRLLRGLLALPAEARPRAGRQAAQLRGRAHSVERDRQAVSYHYNVSNDFFALWLDSRMVYSCAYFATPDEDLETAQQRKLDYICRKLRLRPGQRLLDIGCGWGGLVIHAAQHYGVEAVGITVSGPQAELANERIRQAGLEGRCRVTDCDYRTVDEEGGYERLVSVGMVEHVGEKLLPTYFRQAWRLLKPRGLFLNHGVAFKFGEEVKFGNNFAHSYVFPDGEIAPVSTMLRAAEAAGFEVRDVESLREHYALTLQHWLRRLEARHEEARKATDEVTYRVWQLNLTGSADSFRRGKFNVFQALLVKPERGDSGLPLTRADWYA